MASLVESSLLNGMDNDLTTSIQFVGGDTSPAVGVVDLAEVVRTQLISNKAIGEGIYDSWLFGTPETNEVWEKCTESTNAVQAKVIAKSIKDVYDKMITCNKSLIYVVDALPLTEKSLSAIYLFRNNGEYSAHHYIKEGGKIRQIDLGILNINFDELFYATRSEFLENKSNIDKYLSALEDTLRALFGDLSEGEPINIIDAIQNLDDKINEIDFKFESKLEECVKKADLKEVTYERAGLMSIADKKKLDSISTMDYSDLNEILTL